MPLSLTDILTGSLKAAEAQTAGAFVGVSDGRLRSRHCVVIASPVGRHLSASNPHVITHGVQLPGALGPSHGPSRTLALGKPAALSVGN